MDTAPVHEDNQYPDPQSLGTVLITGGAGIVGSHLAEAFVKSNPKPAKIVATYHSQKATQFACPRVSYHVCDITSADEVSKLLDEVRPTLIIHTISPGPWASASLQHKINYEATEQLVELAKKHPSVQAFIYTSSIFAVELPTTPPDVPLTEETAKLNILDSSHSITSAYARTKGAADALVLAANTGRSLPHSNLNDTQSFSGQLLTCTLRIGGLYGERDEKTLGEMLKLVNTSATRVQFGNDEASMSGHTPRTQQ
ncbi:NAD(P)-binding protein [Westerdykella ornata]|uniref:NAD(P)-binding protein n=1 Tax=Westerdykella ornata TaxID=318751 RepID=A0A6A6JL03_WESOR|nr:NAD(P)-binding protein [Westerdykella ornata]KAF2276915.1 NAD(P)-binding protein [Westerdykella ornata]